VRWGLKETDGLRETLTIRASIRTRIGILAVIVHLLLFSAGALADSTTDIYKRKCAACHGASGAGDTMLGKNLKVRSLRSSEVQKLSDDELFNIISKGRYKMPAFDRKLSKDQIHDLVRHIRSLH
jgi:mono/diheme cytochrome c family protein